MEERGKERKIKKCGERGHSKIQLRSVGGGGGGGGRIVKLTVVGETRSMLDKSMKMIEIRREPGKEEWRKFKKQAKVDFQNTACTISRYTSDRELLLTLAMAPFSFQSCLP